MPHTCERGACCSGAPCLQERPTDPAPRLTTPPSLLPGLEVEGGTFFWSEPPPKPKEAGKKGGPGGPPAKAAAKAASKKGGASFLRRSASKKAGDAAASGEAGAVVPAAANGKAEADGVAVVELPAMGEEGATGAASPAKDNQLSDSAREGASSGTPSPPPEGAAHGSKDAAWWLHDINLQVGGPAGWGWR